MLLSCNTLLTLGLIQSRPRLDYLPPRASLIASNEDHPRKTKTKAQVHNHEVTTKTNDQCHTIQGNTSKPPTLITTQEQILQEYPDIFEGIGKFPGPQYHIQVDPNVTPKQTPCRPILIHLKDAFQKEISQMLQPGVLLPVTEATLWINSFVLVEKRDNHGQVKLRICLDPTILNKAIIQEPYHFQTPEDISHMLADTCILTVCDCKKGNWHQTLDEASSYLMMFNTEVGRYRFVVMPFSIMVAGDIFQRKLDECFGCIKNLIIIADDIMIIGKHHNHKDHDLAFTTLLQTARRCNVKLNYDKIEVQVHRGQLLWQNLYNRWTKNRS